ncbi:MAG: tetratricopeptide repeat protein [Albidovulum sp.]|nr:tetratricopeptide repeat protein [Albidovulum sp.]
MAGPVAADNFEDGGFAYQQGDTESALSVWRSMADKGDRDAQFNLGIIYAQGLGIDQDRTRAIDWFRLAAEQGDPIAAFNLGVIFSEKESAHLDYSLAVSFYELAAAKKHPEAMEDLSILFANGMGVERNLSRAVSLATEAEELDCLVGETEGNFKPRFTRLALTR